MQMNTRPQDVLAVSRWLTLDELEPAGRELVLAMKQEQGSPYTFFVTRKTEEGLRPRFFASWVHEAVLVDAAPLRLDLNSQDREAETSVQARNRLQRFFEEVTGADEQEFDQRWRQAAALMKAMKERGLLG